MARDFRVPREDEEAARWPILVILLVALIVRLLGVGYGLPWSFDREEERTVRQAFEITAYSWRPERVSRPLFMDYIVAGEYGATFAVGHLIGRVGPIHEFEKLFLTRPSLFIVLARLASVFFGICAVYLVYVIGRSVSEWAVGIMAALIVAFSPHHVAVCRSGSPTSLAFLLFVLGAYYFVVLAEEKRFGSALKAAFILGAAAATDWRLVTLLALAYVAYFLVVPREYRLSATLVGLPLVAIAFALGFILPSAPLLLKPMEFLASLKAEVLASLNLDALQNASASTLWLKALVAHDIFSQAVGWALVGAGLIGVVSGLAGSRWKRLHYFMLALVLVAAFVLLFPRDLDGYVRWALFLTPVLALGAATLCYRLIWRKHVPAVVGIVAMALFTAVIAAQGAAEMGIMTIRRTKDDTRAQFASWAGSELPHLSSVLATPGGRFLHRAVWLRGGDQWGQWRTAILEKWSGKAFRVTVIPGPATAGQQEILLSDYNYAVVDDWTVRDLKRDRQAAALAAIDAVRRDGAVVKTFEPSPKPLAGFGPHIEVFRLPAAAEAPATPQPPAPAVLAPLPRPPVREYIVPPAGQ